MKKTLLTFVKLCTLKILLKNTLFNFYHFMTFAYICIAFRLTLFWNSSDHLCTYDSDKLMNNTKGLAM